MSGRNLLSVVSQQQRNTYKKDGVVVLRGILDRNLVELGRKAITQATRNPGPQAEFIYQDSTWQSVSGSFHQEPKSSDDWIMFQDQFSAKRCPEMSDFMQSSNAGRVAAELMGSKTATFFYDHVICKKLVPESNSTNEKSSGDVIPWHQDLPYWNIDGSQIASVWIPLDAIPETDSVKWILGSHRWGLFQPRHFVDASPYQGTDDMDPMPDIDEMIASDKAVVKSFAVEPGDAIVFDARIIHCSGSNHDPSKTQHRRVAFRFGGDDAIFVERKGETAIPTPDILHGLFHGDPLTCDAFPRVWPPDDT